MLILHHYATTSSLAQQNLRELKVILRLLENLVKIRPVMQDHPVQDLLLPEKLLKFQQLRNRHTEHPNFILLESQLNHQVLKQKVL